MCLNPHDPQMMRIFDCKGAFHTFSANTGGGQARDGIFIIRYDNGKPTHNRKQAAEVPVTCELQARPVLHEGGCVRGAV